MLITYIFEQHLKVSLCRSKANHTANLFSFRIVLPNLRAESVIELPSHTIFRSGTAVGDELTIDRYAARPLPKADQLQTTIAHNEAQPSQAQHVG